MVVIELLASVYRTTCGHNSPIGSHSGVGLTATGGRFDRHRGGTQWFLCPPYLQRTTAPASTVPNTGSVAIGQQTPALLASTGPPSRSPKRMTNRREGRARAAHHEICTGPRRCEHRVSSHGRG